MIKKQITSGILTVKRTGPDDYDDKSLSKKLLATHHNQANDTINVRLVKLKIFSLSCWTWLLSSLYYKTRFYDL